MRRLFLLVVASVIAATLFLGPSLVLALIDNLTKLT